MSLPPGRKRDGRTSGSPVQNSVASTAEPPTSSPGSSEWGGPELDAVSLAIPRLGIGNFAARLDQSPQAKRNVSGPATSRLGQAGIPAPEGRFEPGPAPRRQYPAAASTNASPRTSVEELGDAAVGDRDGGELGGQQRVELLIGGMTCAACANRVSRTLNRMLGVSASVNYATEKASVTYPPGVSVEDVVAEVVKAGYTATLPEPPPSTPTNDTFGAFGAGGGRVAGTVMDAARTRLVVCVALTLPVVGLAMLPVAQFVNWQWLSLTLASPVVVWGASPFHRAAWNNARHRAASMDTLVSIGVIAAYGWSLFTLFFGRAGVPGLREHVGLMIEPGSGISQIYLEAAAGVTTFVLVGRFLEARSKRDAGAALRALLNVAAPDVAVVRPTGPGRADIEQRIPTVQLVIGDRFIVRPGEKVATDGVVQDGVSALDTSILTGESVPHEVGPGTVVVGGSLNTGGRLVVRATHLGAHTLLARITALVEQAQTGKANVQRLADRVASVFVPAVLVAAGCTFAVWLLGGGGIGAALQSSVAVLIIACPCALGLATPTALLVGTGRGAQLGVLIKGPEVLESTRLVDTVVLDKTGTLTTGQMQLTRVLPDGGEDAEQVLILAGAVEDRSEHPIGRAIAAAARERHLHLPAVTGFRVAGGFGVSASIDGYPVAVGRLDFLTSLGMTASPQLRSQHHPLNATTETGEHRGGGAGPVVAVGWAGRIRGLVCLHDTVKPGSAATITQLRELGLTPVLLTGDAPGPGEATARAVGIDTVIAGVTPEDKVAVVRALQAEGRVVAMVGDGINDAAALAAADLGLAMGTGTDAAIEAADLTLVAGDPTSIATAIRLSRATLATIRANMFWAFAYNVVAVPLAATGMLNPMIGGAAMATSSLFVVGNSLRLRRFTPSTCGTTEPEVPLLAGAPAPAVPAPASGPAVGP